MTLTGLLDAVRADPGSVRCSRPPGPAGSAGSTSSRWPGVRSPLLAALAGGGATPVLAVTATGREAEDLAAALRGFLPADRRRRLPGLGDAAARAAVARAPTPSAAGWPCCAGWRTPTRTTRRRPAAASSSPRSGPSCSRWSRGSATWSRSRCAPATSAPLDDVVEALAAAAYTRVDLVERRGEFAVRGGILDVFPPTEEHPLRVEFWGDTVEEIRWFAVADQRSLEVAGHGLWAPPCRELLLTDEVRERAAALAEQLPGVAEMLDKIAEGIAVEGMESLAPVLVDGMEPLLDLLPARHARRPAATRSGSAPARTTWSRTSEEFLEASWANAAAGERRPGRPAGGPAARASYRALAEVRAHAARPPAAPGGR